jgi:hypothetical protein
MSIMRKSFLFLCLGFILIACNSDKGLVKKYLQNNYPDKEIEIVGDITVDSAFCPRVQLEEVGLEIDSYKAQLDRLLAQNPDSALILAKVLQNRFFDKDAFIKLAYPKGKKNCMAYMVKCKEDGKKRIITFFKSNTDDSIEFSSLDVDDVVDNLLESFEMLKDGISIIVNDKELNGGQKEQKETQAEDSVEE